MTFTEWTLDDCCGEGGGARSVVQAGHHVTGVDINPACRDGYLRSGAHEFICADILEVLADNSLMGRFTFTTAHPRCQGYSGMSHCRPGLSDMYPRLIRPIQPLLDKWGGPFTIENVSGARGELRNPVTYCMWMFGRQTYRHRLIEAGGGFMLTPPVPPANGGRIHGSGGGRPHLSNLPGLTEYRCFLHLSPVRTIPRIFRIMGARPPRSTAFPAGHIPSLHAACECPWAPLTAYSCWLLLSLVWKELQGLVLVWLGYDYDHWGLEDRRHGRRLLWRVGVQMGHQPVTQLVGCVGRIREPRGPVTARVERVPSGAVLVVSPFAWVVVPESVDYQVPDWPVGLDHQLLGHGDEQHVRDEPPAGEVFCREILGLVDGFPVMVKPVAEDPGPLLFLNLDKSFTGAFGNGAADIDRRRISGDAAIKRITRRTREINSVNATAPERMERVEFRKRARQQRRLH